MTELGRLKSEEQRLAFIRARFAEYQAQTAGFTHPKAAAHFLRYALHYVECVVDYEVEGFFENYLFAVCIAHREGGYDSALEMMVEDAAAEMPEDVILRHGPRFVRELTEADCEELTCFMEWCVRKYSTGATRQRYLGLIRTERPACHPKFRGMKLPKYRTPSERLEQDQDFLRKCRSFLDEYTPSKICAYLDRYIIGQDNAKRCVSLAVYNHYLRILHPDERLVKPNVLLIGPSGCGKTEIIRRLRSLVDVPVVITDFSTVVATPWKGKNKEEALSALLLAAGMDEARAECGIVFIDEFDKTASGQEFRRGNIQDELQGQMLGMLEGTMIDVPSPEDKDEIVTLDTSGILFICAGAFEGLEKVVAAERKVSAGSYGLPSMRPIENLTDADVTREHLIKYGYKSELIGRFGEICVMQALSREQLRRVFYEPEDSILLRYQNEFRLGADKDLIFTPEAIEAIIDRMEEMRIGARGLNAILHSVLADALYEAPGQSGGQVVVTPEDVRSAVA